MPRMQNRVALGLSPRLRGNLLAARAANLLPGSIPAPAGEPRSAAIHVRASKVYPRACGGTGYALTLLPEHWGLSPRLRGNRRAPCPYCAPSGSIPAPAGEPSRTRTSRRSSRVYPRACGGTKELDGTKKHSRGLSPRLRGNPLRRHSRQVEGGSIPAPAGEPPSAGAATRAGSVYPRACGGTWNTRTIGRYVKGLSPRLRGNR